jgi:hypothetical protein
MNISKDVINDLLPLYFAEDCSADTKQLVEEYLKSNPDFEKHIKRLNQNPMPKDIPQILEEVDEMKSLLKTRRLLKAKGIFMGFAIFFSLLPFSFVASDEHSFFMLLDAPLSALFFAICSIPLWIGYFIVKRKSSDL